MQSQDNQFLAEFMVSYTPFYVLFHTFRREQLMTCFFTPANRMDV